MKPWLANYSPNVPEYIDTDQYSSLIEMFDQSIKRFHDKACYSSFGVSISFRQLSDRVERLAAWLQQRGIGPDYRVALMLPNIIASAQRLRCSRHYCVRELCIGLG
jgi:long-chain acyl-CoA synthetase